MPKFWRSSIVAFLRFILMNILRRRGLSNIFRTFLLGSIRCVVIIRTALLLRTIVIIPKRTVAPTIILVPRIRIASLLRNIVVGVAESINIHRVGKNFARVSPLIIHWMDFSYASLVNILGQIRTGHSHNGWIRPS